MTAYVRAHRMVQAALKRGDLVRPTRCSRCRRFAWWALYAHHDDYTKPLAVRWLCSECHGRWHRRLCELCRGPLPARRLRGPWRRYCSTKCRQTMFRWRASLRV